MSELFDNLTFAKTSSSASKKKKRVDERFFVIQSKSHLYYRLLSEFDRMPANFKKVNSIGNKKVYEPNGLIKKEFSHIQKFDFHENQESEMRYRNNDFLYFLPANTSISDIILIKKFGANEHYLWLKKEPIPAGYLKVDRLYNRPVFHEGILVAKCREYPLHPLLLMKSA